MQFFYEYLNHHLRQDELSAEKLAEQLQVLQTERIAKLGVSTDKKTLTQLIQQLATGNLAPTERFAAIVADLLHLSDRERDDFLGTAYVAENKAREGGYVVSAGQILYELGTIEKPVTPTIGFGLTEDEIRQQRLEEISRNIRAGKGAHDDTEDSKERRENLESLPAGFVSPEEIEEAVKPVPAKGDSPSPTPPKKRNRKSTLDLERGRKLADEQAGSRIDLANEGIPQSLSAKLKTILQHQNDEGKTLFGNKEEPLRFSQQETLEKFTGALDNSITSGYATLPGGVGKTRLGIVSASAAKDAGLRTLYIVPSLMAADNVCKKLHETRPDISVGRVFDGHAEYDKDVTVVVYHSLYRQFYHSLIAQDEGMKPPFDLRDYRMIIADEAHEYITPMAKSIFNNTDAIKLALTATDKYHDGKEVQNIFGHQVNKVDMDQACLRGEIATPNHRCIETAIDLKLDEIADLGDKDELLNEALEKRVNNEQWNQVFVDIWKDDIDREHCNRHIAGDRTFIHCAGVRHAQSMANQFNEKLMPLVKGDESFRQILREKGIDPDKVEQVAAPISHLLSPDERIELMEKYKRREVLALTSAKMLIASVDDPQTGLIMNAVPTFSRVRAAQRGYRGSRQCEDKTPWYIYEVLPHDWENGNYAPVLFAESVGDPSLQNAMNGEPQSKSEKNKSDVNVSKRPDINWKPVDIEDVLEKLHLIRMKQRGLEALNPEWIAEHDNQRGRYLQALRRRANLSRQDVAEAVGVSSATIWNYERGLGFQDIKPATISGLGVKKFIDIISPLYQMTPEEEKTLLRLFLPALDPEYFAKIPEPERPAILLKSYRLREGVPQKAVARALGKDDTFQANISAWERRKTNQFQRAFIDDMSVSEIVDNLATVYRMTDEESTLLLHTFLPALDPKWLDKQPENRQLGLYLHALRRKGSSFSYEEMVDRLGVNFNWEKRGGIDPSKLPIPYDELLQKLQESYHLSGAETTRITQLMLPALDPEKLTGMPEEKRLGELLAAYRKRASLRQDKAGEIIGEIHDRDFEQEQKAGSVKFGTISSWESRNAPPVRQSGGVKQYLSAIIEAYQLSEADAQQLTKYALPPLSEEWLDEQPPKECIGYLLTAYRHSLGLNREQMAAHFGTDATMLGRYETGKSPLPETVSDTARKYLSEHCQKLYNDDAFTRHSGEYFMDADAPSPIQEEEANLRGTRLKELREAAHLNLKEAAEKIGVSNHTLANYEKGNGFEEVRHDSGGRMGVTGFIQAMSAAYGTSDAQNTELMHLFLPALDPELQKGTPLEERLPGLLKAFRLRAGLGQSEAMEAAGISSNFSITLSSWENGTSRPDRVPPSDISIPKFIEKITPIYHLNESEAKLLLEAFFPPLNKEWLYHQPEEKQLGLLLKAYRLREGTMTRKEAEAKLGFSLRAEKREGARMEPSRMGIPLEEIISKFQKVYHLSEEETTGLGNYIGSKRSIPELVADHEPVSDTVDWSHIKQRREALGLTLKVAAEKIGIKWNDLAAWERRVPPLNRNSGVKKHILDIARAYDLPKDTQREWLGLALPPLLPEWLETQPEEKRAGLMFMAYRQHIDVTREEFASQIGATENQLASFETGKKAPPSEIIEEAISHFKEHSPELFDETAFRHHLPHAGKPDTDVSITAPLQKHAGSKKLG